MAASEARSRICRAVDRLGTKLVRGYDNTRRPPIHKQVSHALEAVGATDPDETATEWCEAIRGWLSVNLPGAQTAVQRAALVERLKAYLTDDLLETVE